VASDPDACGALTGIDWVSPARVPAGLWHSQYWTIMAVIDMNGRRMSTPWHPDDLTAWRGQIGQDSQAATGNPSTFEDEIRQAINDYVDAQNGWVTSGYVAGRDWTTTPFQHIQDALRDRGLASECLGLFVCDVLIQRNETWEILAHNG
jgi:hypothetical protein